MAGAYPGNRSLEQTPTWAVAVVCFVLVLISILIEHSIHLVGRWFIRRQKRALYEALEKVKSELMLLGFISLLLTIGQGPISNICIPQRIGDSWHPCSKERKLENQNDGSKRRLLWVPEDVEKRRILAGGGPSKCREGTVPFVSSEGIHQLHIFIFVLAVFHILHCVATMFLGRLKMKSWKSWENETKTVEYQFTHDPERFRLARDTSFGRRHLSFWSKSPILLWTVCFFRQFVTSVAKVDYLTLRHGFIVAHLSHQSATKFDFHKYIKRSLEEDFKVVVGISPTIWFCAVLFLLFYTHGSYSYFWLPFLPLIVILMVGTKLQVIITKMGVKISERGDVVKGLPLVQPDDNLFWFNKPRLMLYLAHFVLFQNAFQLAFFVWAWYEFGLQSCFHEKLEDITIRLSMGLLIQFLCSYVILPLYALVSQMGSTMKPTIFNERVASALKKWLYTARKHIKDNRRSGSVTPRSPRSPSPSQGLSPVHLLHRYKSEVDSYHNSPNFYSLDKDKSEPTSPSNHPPADEFSSRRFSRNTSYEKEKEKKEKETLPDQNATPQEAPLQHEINVYPEFSFDKLQGEAKRF